MVHPENNQSFHAYNYWKHLIKESMVDSVLPDIVPISADTGIVPSSPSTGVVPAPSHDLSESHISPILSDSPQTVSTPSPVAISLGDIRIEIGAGASDDVNLASLRRCVMFKDAAFSHFPAVYVVCGYTDMRCGIDSLAAII